MDNNGMMNKFGVVGEIVSKNLKMGTKNGANIISGDIVINSKESTIPVFVSCSEYTNSKQPNKNWNTYVQLMNAPTKASNGAGAIVEIVGNAYTSEGYGKDSGRYYCISNQLRGTFISLNPRSVEHKKWWMAEGFIEEIVNGEETINGNKVNNVVIKLINIGYNDRVNRFEIKTTNPEYIDVINTKCSEKMPISCSCDVDFISITETEEIPGMIGSRIKTKTITQRDFIIQTIDGDDSLNDEYSPERLEEIMAKHELQMKDKKNTSTPVNPMTQPVNTNTFATAVNNSASDTAVSNFAYTAAQVTPPDLGF